MTVLHKVGVVTDGTG